MTTKTIDTLYIYIDESGAPGDGEFFQVGALMTDEPIGDGIVRQGLTELKNDSEATGRLDKSTLSRGYFHASADSKNAHSHLCRSIVQHVTRGSFRLLRWRHAQAPVGERALHWSCVILATIGAISLSTYDVIKVIVATRQKSFDMTAAKSWLQTLQQDKLASLIQQPNVPCRFPAITVEVVDADVPGIQACDFVLWATQRAHYENLKPTRNFDWVERLGLDPKGQSKAERQETVDFDIGRWNDRAFVPKLGEAPRRIEELGEDLAPSLMAVANGALILASKSHETTPDARYSHLAIPAARAAKALSRVPINGDSLSDVARAFLMACDTLPVYDVASGAECARAWEFRRLAAEMLSNTIRGVRLRDHWARLLNNASRKS